MSMVEIRSIETAMRSRLANALTVDAMEQMIRAITDVLSDYEIRRNAADEIAGEDFILDAYLDAIRVEGRSAKTVDRYAYILRRVFRASQANTRSITVYHIRKYLGEEKARGIAEGTLDGVRQVCSAYFNWCMREGLLQKNPMGNIGSIKSQKKVRKAFSEVEIEMLKNSCKTKRDKAIVCFLEATGCRISEMTGLNREDVNLERGECVVLGKGNKQRTAYINPVACMAIREYLDGRNDDDPALFVGRGCKRIEPNGVRVMLKKLGAAAGVENVHPHRFRRTRATTLIRHGMAVQEVASILGHEKIDTTMKYVVLDQTQIRSSYQRFA